MSSDFIPFSTPAIGEEEINEVVAALRSGWLTTGPRTAQFENEFRAYVGAESALGVNSATAGLHLALAALGIGPGHEVITTPLTFCSTVNTILHTGATPVLADVGKDGNIDPGSIGARIGVRTRAIIPVHLGGLPCDMDAIWEIARTHGLHVIEDAAHAIGSHYRGRPIGAGNPTTGMRSDAVAFSFYATKNLTTGEGGMVTTHSEPLFDAMRVLCLHGISKDAWNRYSEQGNWYYEVEACGFKYNLSDIQSAIGIHQLRKQERFLEVRTRYAAIYQEELEDLDELELPPQYPWCRHSWHLYAPRLNLEMLEIDRHEFIRQLRIRKIGASVHFIPIPLHPFFAAMAKLPQNQCPEALKLYPRLVSLPLYPSMSEDEIRHVASAVRDIIASVRKKPLAFRGAYSGGIAG
jgi:dTDP-4-amino-4,6-dideoxygalactose transaminase